MSPVSSLSNPPSFPHSLFPFDSTGSPRSCKNFLPSYLVFDSNWLGIVSTVNPKLKVKMICFRNSGQQKMGANGDTSETQNYLFMANQESTQSNRS